MLKTCPGIEPAAAAGSHKYFGSLPTVYERTEHSCQYSMATPEFKFESEAQEEDVSYLSVKKKSKIERCTKKLSTHSGPSKLIVVLKWITTTLFAAVILASLVSSKITLLGLAWNVKSGTEREEAFVMCLVVLLAPNVISLVRALWNVIGRSDIPWPSKDCMALVVLSSALESAGLCILVFKTLASGSAASGVSAMQIGFVLPILYHLKKGNRDIRCFRPAVFFSLLCALGGTGVVIYIYVKNSAEVWSLVGIVLVFIAWLPSFHKKMFSPVKSTDIEPKQRVPRGSINRSNTSRSYLHGQSLSSEYSSFKSTYRSIISDIPSPKPDPISEVPCDKTTAWKVLLISSFTKIIFIFGVSSLLPLFLMRDMKFKDIWDKGWDWGIDNMFVLFIVHTSSGIVAYVTGVFACHTCMDRGAFVVPLILSSPLSVVLLVVSSSCDWFKNYSEVSVDFCVSGSSSLVLSIVAMLCTSIALILVFGRVLWNVNKLVLQKETQLFWFPAYNSVMIEQWLFVNRKLSGEKENGIDKTRTRKHEKTRVYICTTMYRESRKEMQQLLESIEKIRQATSSSSAIHFESHVFLDDAVRGYEVTEFALQLVSLLKEALGIEYVLKCTKTATPYGMKLVWKLPGPSEMTFTIHLKDTKKVKKKKRWSQIMYMSYVLDFLSKQYVDKDGNLEVKDSDCFILTTDADVKFTPESVEALLDLMKRDTSVGAVCARTYPLGEGPLVWYQQFEYAVGHWFQKAAEHVLGSVLCAPGSFSVYRCSALKDIVPTYATTVERAFDFLIKDMGEDRWLCTLMVQSGWRIEYCAASENETYCPEEFGEFYKQRRRWIASTLANIISLIKEWSLIRALNHRVSYLFCVYQIFLLTSTFIGPSTVIIIIAGGLDYAWGVNVVWSVVLQIAVCLIYTLICVYKNEKWQMQSGKIITFLYAVVMTAVLVGIAEQVAEDLINFDGNKPKSKPGGGDSASSTIEPITRPPGAISDDFPISFVTLYLGLLVAIFIVTGMLHPSEFKCLLNGIIYLLCLPSGYLVLNIYSIVNITDRSWGTREEKEHNTVKVTKPWYNELEIVMRKVFFCCDKKETLEAPPVAESKDDPVNRRHRRDSQTEPLSPQRLSQTIGPGIKYSDEEEQSESGEEYDEENPMLVEKWLPKGMKSYAKIFIDNGFQNTNFLGKLTEIDLKRLGIKKLAHRRNLHRRIQNIPEFRIPVGVPRDPNTWLETVGLAEYKANFRQNHIKTVRDMEALKSFTEKEIREDLHITKPGHIQRMKDAIKRLRNPTKEEREIAEMKEEISQAFKHDLRSVNKEEHKFWKDLLHACLEPDLDAFGSDEILKGNLLTLRNEWLMVSGIVNCLWIVIIMTLSRSIDLQIAGTNPLSLVFLIVFGFLFVLQFVCMLVHRFTTLSHFIARAPYRFGQSYQTSLCQTQMMRIC
uniref:chitin synthase n=1 Tax=Crassostrea virginica TaxID=6565 RepID=A0A8B8BT98_CRAVI|nr:uncharacterized protein LOC111112966 isoform X3 [Crassostrea virginica]